jgi:5S rRNA maturation endonuclease (ribonuclease M5)
MDNFLEFKFFKILDDKESLLELKKEYIFDFCGKISKDSIKKIDYDNGVVEFDDYDFEKSEITGFIYSALEDIILDLERETRSIKNDIDILVERAIINSSDVSVSFKNLENILVSLTKREYLGFPKEHVLSSLATILNHLKINYNYYPTFDFTEDNFQIALDDYSPHSYRWISINTEVGKLSLKKFYSLLTQEPKIVECSEKEFINAFSQSKLSNGIKWLIKGKNGQYSKQSLIQFIDYLMANKYIETKSGKDFNESVRYVFRDNNGLLIKNVSVSKSSSTKVPSEWDRIKDIVNKI